MKRILNTFIISAAVVLSFSCQERELDMPMNEKIVLDLSTGITKAEDTSAESFVNHLDVFFFESDGTSPAGIAYYDRYTVNNASELVLTAKRSSFQENKKYFVYLIANSNLSESEYASITIFNDLIDKKQQDLNLHMSGLSIDGVPGFFLMDAVAYDAYDAEQVILNNGVLSDNTVLNATLKRAAAKVVINIEASENVEFKPFNIEEGSQGGLYYVRNLPYDTFLLAEAKDADAIEASLITTSKSANEYFSWKPESDSKNVSLITYVYPHSWSDESILEQETCVVMNLPLTYTSDGISTDYPNSWYKIQMTDNKMFERNKYYEVNINLNRPGAVSEAVPVEFEEVYYSVIDWVDISLSVGGDDKPVYLMVNEEDMEMRNVAVDATTLEFASSSPVTVTVKDVYYYDKFGAIQQDNITITGTTESGLIAGNITINSPVPTNKTIRYFTLVITNEDGLSREVQVAQYPLEYITNKVSWYSYRSDFIGSGQSVPTTYQNVSAANDVTSISYSNGQYTYNSGSTSGFFRSKVVADTYSSTSTSESYRGRSDIDGYYWDSSRRRVRTSDVQDPGNARMYHIQIMASSGDYVLGRPKITDGITDSGEDNAKLVSPSFMIASRLATITTANIDLSASSSDTEARNAEYLDIYAEHCKQYVEVYDPDNDPSTDNAIHYDDWRLPTAAEIGIIYKYQGTADESADAIDYLLNASAYFSASGPVTNPNSNSTGTSVRCIRDAY